MPTSQVKILWHLSCPVRCLLLSKVGSELEDKMILVFLLGSFIALREEMWQVGWAPDISGGSTLCPSQRRCPLYGQKGSLAIFFPFVHL